MGETEELTRQERVPPGNGEVQDGWAGRSKRKGTGLLELREMELARGGIRGLSFRS